MCESGGYRADRYDMQLISLAAQEVLGFVHRQDAGRIGKQAAVDVLAVVEGVAGEVARRCAGGQGHIDQTIAPVTDQIRVMRGLEQHWIAGAVVDRRHQHRMLARLERALAKQRVVSEQIAQGRLRVGRT